MSDNLTIPMAEYGLAARLTAPEAEPRAGVVIAHGLFSFMASEKLTRLAGDLARAGCAALQYDAAGCGDTPGDVMQTTLTGRRDELLVAARWLSQRHPGLPLVYLGSSLGGTAAILAADIEAPAATVCWSTPTELEALFLKLSGQPDRPDLPALARDIARHDMEAVLARSSRILFVHGREDEVVPVGQAHRGFELAREPKDLLILEHGDHRISDLALQKRATEHTLAWLGPLL